MRNCKKPQFKTLSAGVVPVLLPKENLPPRFLLLRAYRNWDFPKGRVESGEEPLAAALRELREETNIDQVQFCFGKDFKETEPYSGGKIARYYLAQIKSPEVSLLVNPDLGFPEHHEYRWASYAEAKNIVNPRVLAILDWANTQVQMKMS